MDVRDKIYAGIFAKGVTSESISLAVNSAKEYLRFRFDLIYYDSSRFPFIDECYLLDGVFNFDDFKKTYEATIPKIAIIDPHLPILYGTGESEDFKEFNDLCDLSYWHYKQKNVDMDKGKEREWWKVLGVYETDDSNMVHCSYRKLVQRYRVDNINSGCACKLAEVEKAWNEFVEYKN